MVYSRRVRIYHMCHACYITANLIIILPQPTLIYALKFLINDYVGGVRRGREN
jgi:hypothetical protein